MDTWALVLHFLARAAALEAQIVANVMITEALTGAVVGNVMSANLTDGHT